jgi:hypothetical protein
MTGHTTFYAGGMLFTVSAEPSLYWLTDDIWIMVDMQAGYH